MKEHGLKMDMTASEMARRKAKVEREREVRRGVR